MFKSVKGLQILSAAVALIAVAGCAEQSYEGASAKPTAPSAMAANPELAGAWYQIYFDTDKADIKARGTAVVENVAYVATHNEMTRVTVIGRADRVGDAPSNMALSQQRADTVRDALIAAGVPANNINTLWTGEASQKVMTFDEKSEQLNRVVDITVMKMMPRKM